MANFGEKNRFKSQMFESGNRLRFERPVDDTGRQWWLAKFYESLELTPEGMADRLTKSAPGSKSAVYHYIDGVKETFSLRIDGDFPGTEEFWYAQRSLDLKGSAFGADGMFVSEGAQGMGRGSALMGDLIDTAKLIGVEKITRQAEKIGHYAWIKLGFLPDAGSWMHLKKDALSFILSHESRLGTTLTNDLVRQVHKGGPEVARTLAFVDVPVPSRDLAARYEPPLVPFGRAFFLEIATDWHGTLDLRDETTMKLVASYRDKSLGEAMAQRIPSGEFRYPSHHWGALAQNPTLEIGATGEAWVSAVKSAWMQAGGTEESFEQAFPNCACDATVPVKHV